MSLISHPSSSLRIVKYVHARGGDGFGITRIPFPSKNSSSSSTSSAGVTMGIIYDIVHDFLNRNSASSFCLVFQQDRKTGEVGITLALYMTVQCTVWLEMLERVSLRSEGEETTVRELEWRRERGEEDGDVPGMRDVWESELTLERGGVE